MNTNLNLNKPKIQQYEKQQTRLLTRSVRHSGTDNDWIQLKNYNAIKRNFELKE